MEKYKQRLAEMQADRQGLANTLDEQQEQNKVLKTQVSNDQGDVAKGKRKSSGRRKW